MFVVVAGIDNKQKFKPNTCVVICKMTLHSKLTHRSI